MAVVLTTTTTMSTTVMRFAVVSPNSQKPAPVFLKVQIIENEKHRIVTHFSKNL